MVSAFKCRQKPESALRALCEADASIVAAVQHGISLIEDGEVTMSLLSSLQDPSVRSRFDKFVKGHNRLNFNERLLGDAMRFVGYCVQALH